MQTAVGYCGGEKPQPTYKNVCSNPDYADYAEALHIDFDPSVLSYEQVCLGRTPSAKELPYFF